MPDVKQIEALLRLIDDPDAEVYDTVAHRLIALGKPIIPQLEQLWEQTLDEAIQSRIEWLIHRVHFENLQKEFYQWSKEPQPSLFRGAVLMAQYAYPELDVVALTTQLEKMRKNIWLELNNYLTPLEQINIFNSILYNYYKLQGHELTERKPDHFFINKVFESRQGNTYSFGVLFLSLCELLDVPVFAIDLPRQFIFAYLDSLQAFYQAEEVEPLHQIQFFIDPLNGMVYTKGDVEAYLKKLNLKPQNAYYLPIRSVRIVYKMLEELSLCYQYNNEEEKAAEIQSLMQLLSSTQE